MPSDAKSACGAIVLETNKNAYAVKIWMLFWNFQIPQVTF